MYDNNIARFLSPQPRMDPLISYNYGANLVRTPYSQPNKPYGGEVRCSNCQQMINANIIEMHTLSCYKATEKVFPIENNLSIPQIDSKLQKMREAVEVNIRSRGPNVDPKERQNSQATLTYIDKLLSYSNGNDSSQMSNLKSLLNEIQDPRLSASMQSSQSVLLYFERVKHLAKDKYRELMKQDHANLVNWKDNFKPSPTPSYVNSPDQYSQQKPSLTPKYQYTNPFDSRPQQQPTQYNSYNQNQYQPQVQPQNSVQNWQNSFQQNQYKPIENKQPDLNQYVSFGGYSSQNTVPNEKQSSDPKLAYNLPSQNIVNNQNDVYKGLNSQGSQSESKSGFQKQRDYLPVKLFQPQNEFGSDPFNGNNFKPQDLSPTKMNQPKDQNNQYGYQIQNQQQQQPQPYQQQSFTQQQQSKFQYENPFSNQSTQPQQQIQQVSSNQNLKFQNPLDVRISHRQIEQKSSDQRSNFLSPEPNRGTILDPRVTITTPQRQDFLSVEPQVRKPNTTQVQKEENDPYRRYAHQDPFGNNPVKAPFQRYQAGAPTVQKYNYPKLSSESVNPVNVDHPLPSYSSNDLRGQSNTQQKQPSFIFQPIQTDRGVPLERVNNFVSPKAGPSVTTRDNRSPLTTARESSGSRDEMRNTLENKLENKKKELTEISKMIDNYKKKTESIQNTINQKPSISRDFSRESMSPGRPHDNSFGSAWGANDDVNKYIKVRNNIISDVESDIYNGGMSSKWSESQETSSNLDRNLRDTHISDVNELDALYQQKIQGEGQEEQRIFYSKCLAHKMKLKSREDAQHIPVSLVYRDAIQQGIKQEHWDNFISQAFLHPEKYIDVSKIKSKKKHGIKNKLTEMAQHKFNLQRNYQTSRTYMKNKPDLLGPIEVIYE